MCHSPGIGGDDVAVDGWRGGFGDDGEFEAERIAGQELFGQFAVQQQLLGGVFDMLAGPAAAGSFEEGMGA